MTREQLAELLGNNRPTQLDVLDERQMEIISMMSQGKASRQIAEELAISPETLAVLKAEIQKKLKLKNEIALVQFAAQQRI